MAKRSIAERLAQLEAQRKTLQSKLGKQERTGELLCVNLLSLRAC